MNDLLQKAILLSFLLPAGVQACAQQPAGIAMLLDSIERYNPVSRMYEAEIRAMDEAARGARSWMPPEVGAGFFMTPYNPSLWKSMDDGEPAMGSFMLSAQQMIPNRRSLDAGEAYMKSMSAAAAEQRRAALNELFAQAKKAYYEWVIIERKKAVLVENEKLLEMMIKDAEIRYRHGLDRINAYYKAKAAVGEIAGMQIMLDSEIRLRRITLNTLAYRAPEVEFSIDTSVMLKDYTRFSVDSAILLQSRSDIRALEREQLTNRLRMEAERQNLKPQFGIRFDHMIPFAGRPQQFTLMGMVRLPMVPWAARMTKANIESYTWRNEVLNSQRQMLLNEAMGMAGSMLAELNAVRRQISLYENHILPALQNNYRTTLLAYQQNTEELFMLFDAWETLNMAQLEYLDQYQKAFTMQAELERILEIR